MPESKHDAAIRLVKEATGYLSNTDKNIPNTRWRNGRLTQIAVWFAKEAPYNSAVTQGTGFYALPTLYFAFEPTLYTGGTNNTGQPYYEPEGTVDYLAYAREIYNWDTQLPSSYLHTGRWYLLDAMTKLSSAELWAWGGILPLFVLPKILSSDPNLETRVKALELLNKVDLPVTIYNPLLSALDTFRDELGSLQQAYGPDTTRNTAGLQKAAVAGMATLRSRIALQQNAAQAAIIDSELRTQANAATQAALTGNVQAAQIAASGIVPTLPPMFDWKPWATLGSVLGLLGGGFFWIKRRRAA